MNISASNFKATCLDLLDQVASGAIDGISITKRGRVVGVLRAPEPDIAPSGVFGCMRGTVTIAPGADLTDPVAPAFEAESGQVFA